MNSKIKALFAALGIALLAAAPAVASAERIFFLVGTRHVYRVGPDMYAHVTERQRIEQDYADQVAVDRDQYNKAMSAGANPDAETADFNSALNDLARERDRQLGSIFENADYMRARHPELRIEGDGPYQVIGINFHMNGGLEVFEHFVVYAPWPGYVVVGHPYGWAYGVVYDPFAFHHVYVGWYGGFVSMGRPAFVGLYGFRGPVAVVGFSRGAHGVMWAPRGGGVNRVIGRSGGSFARPSYGHSFAPAHSSPRNSFAPGRSGQHGSFAPGRSVQHGNFGTGRAPHAGFNSRPPATHGSFGQPRSGAHFGGPRTSTHSSSHGGGGRHRGH